MSGFNRSTSPTNEWHSNEWQDPRWYPFGYQRDQLNFGTAQLRDTPLSKYAQEDMYEERVQESDPLRQLVRVIRHAENLHRFSDRRQDRFEGKPLPDGSNLNIMMEQEDGTFKVNGTDLLRKTFQLYRQWLEWLYLDFLLALDITRNNATNWNLECRINDDLLITQTLSVDFFHAAKMIADQERVQFSELDDVTQFDTDEELNWILLWRRSIANTLQDMKAGCKWADSMGYNHEDSMNKAYGNLSDLHKVLVSILHKEELFESRLHLYHVEDEQFYKRIRLVSAENYAVLGPNVAPLNGRYLPTIVVQTSAFQKRLRNLFNFRQLREWGYGRPWVKLHLVFDTNVRPHLKEPVEKVRELLVSCSRAKDLFGVVPVEQSKLEDCAVCLENWADDDLAMETHCHHYFHAACLMQYWDQDRQFDFRCPLCRTSGGRVRDRVEFAVGREDFVPDASEQAVYAMALEEAGNRLNANPAMIVADLPRGFWLPIGRNLEARLLQQALAHAGPRGGGSLIP